MVGGMPDWVGNVHQSDCVCSCHGNLSSHSCAALLQVFLAEERKREQKKTCVCVCGRARGFFCIEHSHSHSHSHTHALYYLSTQCLSALYCEHAQ